MFTPFSLLLAGLVLVLAGCATENRGRPATDGDAARQCFFRSQVSGFTHAGPDRIHVHVSGDTYLFETFGHCPDLNFSETVGFEQKGPGLICSALDVNLIVPTATGPRTCPVRMIRKLSEAEEAADGGEAHD